MGTIIAKNRVNDSEIVARAQGGDLSAFGELYNLHGNNVYGICLRIFKNPAEAEQVKQDAFVHLFRKIGSFRGRSQFATWLHRVVLNLALETLQSNKKNTDCVSIDWGMEVGDTAIRRALPIADSRLVGTCDRIALEKAILQLPPSLRQALMLYDVEGFNHAEIAQMLGKTVGGSKAQLFKARTRLRQILTQPCLPH